MHAIVMDEPGTLEPRELPVPEPGPGQVRVRVRTCGICRTDLHILDGELDAPKPCLVPGHQVVGVVDELGHGVDTLAEGDRVGIPWLGETCGTCTHCRAGRENLCVDPVFTGYTRDGGFAEHAVADARYCFPLPEGLSDAQVAPLLCAGLIGHRAHRMTGDPKRLGLYGFGSAAHILCQIAVYEGREVYAFTRPGDERGQAFAVSLGATWAGGSDTAPPVELDAAVIFAPVGPLVPEALRRVRPGGTVVCGGIHMSDIPSFPYRLLWEERVVRSVANLTRRDGEELLELAVRAGVRTEVTTYPLDDVGQALEDLRHGRFDGSAVIELDPSHP